MSMRLLVDSDAFWQSLASDIGSARSYVYVQTLSFEGDRVGKALTAALESSSAPDKRVLVDSYTKIIQNDKFLFSPSSLLDSELRAEVRETSAMIAGARRTGIDVRFTNPLGVLLRKLAARNHKKIMVIDDRISYVGGLNFSEHNFEWHDLMLRIDDGDVAAFLRDDFLTTWRGEDVCRSGSFPGIDLHLCDGSTNALVFQKLFDLIDSASNQIFVESPYITFPFFEKLGDARKRGVQVTLISPHANNYPTLTRYVKWECARLDIDLWLYRGRMTHLKAMLIDGRYLIVGSSNFDDFSYRRHQELIAVATDRAVIADFEERVVKHDLAKSVRFTGSAAGLRSRIALQQVKWGARLARLVSR
jgi:cardiolipin synthase